MAERAIERDDAVRCYRADERSHLRPMVARGIDNTDSDSVPRKPAPAHASRRTRSADSMRRGLATTHLQRLATAAALNLVRLGEWFAGTPPAKTRYSPCAVLKAA